MRTILITLPLIAIFGIEAEADDANLCTNSLIKYDVCKEPILGNSQKR